MSVNSLTSISIKYNWYFDFGSVASMDGHLSHDTGHTCAGKIHVDSNYLADPKGN